MCRALLVPEKPSDAESMKALRRRHEASRAQRVVGLARNEAVRLRDTAGPQLRAPTIEMVVNVTRIVAEAEAAARERESVV